MYGTDAPFAEKWRTTMGYIEDDLEAGYPTVWAELTATRVGSASTLSTTG
jgi:hypothetical protein